MRNRVHSQNAKRYLAGCTGLCIGMLAAIGAWRDNARAADLSPYIGKAMQDQADRLMLALRGEFTLTVGGRAYFEPRYDGGKAGVFTGAPLISVKPKGSFEKFTSPRESSGFTVLESEQFFIGPVFSFNNERLPGDDRALRGSHRVDFAFEPGLFIEYLPTDFLRLRAEFRQGIGGHHGQIFDFSADVFKHLDDKKWLVAAGPRLTIATADALGPYFDVRPPQAAATGLPIYTTRGGIRSAGFGVDFRYNWTERFQTELFGEYERLVDRVADSPLVRFRGDPNQYRIGVGATYKFDFVSPM